MVGVAIESEVSMAALRAWGLSTAEAATVVQQGSIKDVRLARESELRAVGLAKGVFDRVCVGLRRERLVAWLRRERGIEDEAAIDRVCGAAGRVEDLDLATFDELEAVLGLDLASRVAPGGAAVEGRRSPGGSSPRGVEEPGSKRQRVVDGGGDDDDDWPTIATVATPLIASLLPRWGPDPQEEEEEEDEEDEGDVLEELRRSVEHGGGDECVRAPLATGQDVLDALSRTRRPTDEEGFFRSFASMERAVERQTRVVADVGVVARVRLAEGAIIVDPGCAPADSDAGIGDDDLVAGPGGSLFRSRFDTGASARTAFVARTDDATVATVAWTVAHRGRPALAWRVLRDLEPGDELVAVEGDPGAPRPRGPLPAFVPPLPVVVVPGAPCAACAGAHKAHTCGARGRSALVAEGAAPPPPQQPATDHANAAAAAGAPRPRWRPSDDDGVTWICALFPRRPPPPNRESVKVPLIMRPDGGFHATAGPTVPEDVRFRPHVFLLDACDALPPDLAARLAALPWYGRWLAKAGPRRDKLRGDARRAAAARIPAVARDALDAALARVVPGAPSPGL